jgi:nucleoside-diphosphate-sugar epimerase
LRYLYDVGIRGTSAVLRAADSADVPHLIHMSSLGTYAPGRYGKKVDESWSTAGLSTSAYSRAKSAAEQLLDDYESTQPDGVGITRLRPGLIVQRDAAAGLRRYTLPAYINPAWLRWLPVLPLDRSLTVSMIHTDDVAEACLKAIQRRAPLVQASWRGRLQPIDRGWFDMAFSAPLLDTTRARDVLDWSPRYSSVEALGQLVDGLLHDSGTPSPVLRPRSLLTAVTRDASRGPVTTRRVP